MPRSSAYDRDDFESLIDRSQERESRLDRDAEHEPPRRITRDADPYSTGIERTILAAGLTTADVDGADYDTREERAQDLQGGEA